MDWLERWLGLNPDGGSGVVEVEIMVAVVLVIAVSVLVGSSRARGAVEAALRRVTAAARARRPS